MRNLLPEKKKKIVNREYLLRLITVSFWLLFFVLIVGTVLILPSYLMIQSRSSALHSRKSLMQQTIVVREKDFSVDSVEKTASYLKHLEKTPRERRLSDLITSIVEKAPTGIKLTTFNYSSGKDSEQKQDKKTKESSGSSLEIRGVANDRDKLISFSDSIEKIEKVKSSELPVSQLADSKNISFYITVKGNF